MNRMNRVLLAYYAVLIIIASLGTVVPIWVILIPFFMLPLAIVSIVLAVMLFILIGVIFSIVVGDNNS